MTQRNRSRGAHARLLARRGGWLLSISATSLTAWLGHVSHDTRSPYGALGPQQVHVIHLTADADRLHSH
jgi:hypothetical protein